jgi:hypothetical protein
MVGRYSGSRLGTELLKRRVESTLAVHDRLCAL